MDKTLNDVSINLLEKLIEEISSVEELRPDDVTAPRLVEKTGRGWTFIRNFLNSKIASGELVEVPCFDAEAGKNVTAYRPKESK